MKERDKQPGTGQLAMKTPPILSQQACEMEDFPIAGSLAVTCKAQRLDGDIQPKLVSILETIN